MVDRTLSLLCACSDDLQGILFERIGGDGTLHDDFATLLSGSTHLDVSRMTAGGWARTMETLRTDPPTAAGRFDVLLTSAAAELADPSLHPRETLIALSRFARERSDAHVIALNGSTLLGSAQGADSRPEYETAIRRLNLAILEASNETGLSVLDADRLVAETRLPGKVTGPFEYSPPIQEVLRSTLASILGALGFAERSLMEVSMPFIRDVAAITIERWSNRRATRSRPVT